MAVVISDFEVVADAAPAGEGARGATSDEHKEQGGAAAAGGATPNDIRRVVRREVERMARIRAD